MRLDKQVESVKLRSRALFRSRTGLSNVLGTVLYFREAVSKYLSSVFYKIEIHKVAVFVGNQWFRLIDIWK